MISNLELDKAHIKFDGFDEISIKKIVGNKELVKIIKNSIKIELEKHKIRRNIIKNIYLEREKNNTQGKWYNRIFDSQYGAHYLTAIHIFLDNPIFGTGLKSFRYYCKYYDKINSLSALSRCSTHPHNQHLEILSDTGIIGYIMYIFLFLFTFKTFLIRENRSSPVYLILFSLILAKVLPILPSGSIFSSVNATYFWLSFSIFYLIKQLKIN